MRPKLVFSDDSEATAEALRRAFRGCPELSASVLKPDQLPKLGGLDALFLTLVAAERWGSRPIPYKAQVLRTLPEDEGLPPYVVTGIAMNIDDERINDPRAELELVMSAVLDAIEVYNSENNGVINAIGFWTELLGINHMNPVEAGQIIRSIYERKYPPIP